LSSNELKSFLRGGSHADIMRLPRIQLLLILLVFFPVILDAQVAHFESLTTTNGTTYKDVTVTRVLDDGIYVKHAGGGGKIPFAELTDETLGKLGIPTHAERQAQQKQFEKEQQEKGLVKYGAKWITPEERKRAEEDEKIDRLVTSKSLTGVRFKVIQSRSEGLLCVMGEWDPHSGVSVYSGDPFFLHGTSNATMADDERFFGDLYWAGMYTYTTAKGVEKTVNSYAVERGLARKLIRAKFNLVSIPK